MLSLTPGDRFPETDIQFADLVVHVTMYGMWMAIFIRELKRQFSSINARLIIYGVLGMSAYGGLLEYLQENYAIGRFGSWSDFAANAFGCIIIGMTYKLLVKRN